MCKQLSLFCLFLLILVMGHAQDVPFSQFYAAPTLLNPAFTGTGEKTRLLMNYRNQWPGLGKAFVTYCAAFDMKSNKLHGGVGLSVLSDVIGSGELASNKVSLMYSYLTKINHDWNLSFGLQTSFMQNSLNWGKLVFPDMIDVIDGAVLKSGQEEPTSNLTQRKIDFSAGGTVYGKRFFVGFSAQHLLEPANNFYDGDESCLKRNYILQAGGIIRGNSHGLRSEPLMFYPNLILQKQGSLEQINYGLYARKNALVGGLWLRQNFSAKPSALVFLLGVALYNFKFSYSYDLPINSMIAHAYSSHELSMTFLFDKNLYKKKKWAALPCPEF